MTETNYTPGPWRYEKGTNTIRSVPANYWLATMDSWDGMVNNAANGALIAEAPKLLNAVELAVATIERLHRHAPGSANGTLDVLRATIGRAKRAS